MLYELGVNGTLCPIRLAEALSCFTEERPIRLAEALSCLNEERPIRLAEALSYDGSPAGFSENELSAALTFLRDAAMELGTDASTVWRKEIKQSHMCHVLLRRNPASPEQIFEVRCAVVGNVDAGKSTTLGVLTRGQLDDGRGRARVNLFRHKHEVESGRTSSVGLEILGYDSKGNSVLPAPGRKLNWEEICARAAKVASYGCAGFTLSCDELILA
ncbi:MAG: hypothetical protein BJ554DRAFT_2721 [Olpidium bornovanus]|uniref:Uncharacterized protein n=1 Tax=Olpidium bornovanus TaxID=278681 RepID=A0A8H7ZQG4_9FUNG|nr:MAG: hypothetical protein BJ554DRAFT_2721 [Olpidium bornovanus]